MRSSWIAAVPLLLVAAGVPAAAQVSARVHIDIPIGRTGRTALAVPRRPLLVREYDPYRDGAWQDYYNDWAPVTVYLYDGDYYDYPVVPYAEPVLVYRFRNEMFLAPRQREFTTWTERYRAPDLRGDGGREIRPAPRNDRSDRQYQPPRDTRIGRDDRNGRAVQPQRDARNGRSPAPARDAGRGRSRPH